MAKMQAKGGVTITVVNNGLPGIDGVDAISVDCPSALQVSPGKPLQPIRVSVRVGARVLLPIASTSNGANPASTPSSGRFCVTWRPANVYHGKFVVNGQHAVLDFAGQEGEYIADAQADDAVTVRLRIYIESLTNYIDRDVTYTLVSDGDPGLNALSLSLFPSDNVSGGYLPYGFQVSCNLMDGSVNAHASITSHTWRVSNQSGQLVAPPADLFNLIMMQGVGPVISYVFDHSDSMAHPVFIGNRDSITYSLSVTVRDGRTATASLIVPLAKQGLQGATGPMTAIPVPWTATDTYYGTGQYRSVVYLNNDVYMCKQTHTNKRPPNATYWEPLGGVQVMAMINAFVVNLFANNAFIKNLKAQGIDTRDQNNRNGITIDKIVKFYNQTGKLVREYGYDANGEVLDRFYDKNGVLRMEYNPTQGQWASYTGAHSYTPYRMQSVSQPAGTEMESMVTLGRVTTFYKYMTYTTAYMQYNETYYTRTGGPDPSTLTRISDGWYVDVDDTATNPGGPTWFPWTRYKAVRFANGKPTDEWHYVYLMGVSPEPGTGRV